MPQHTARISQVFEAEVERERERVKTKARDGDEMVVAVVIMTINRLDLSLYHYAAVILSLAQHTPRKKTSSR